MIYYSKTLQSKISGGKASWGEAWKKQGISFRSPLPLESRRTGVVPPAWSCELELAPKCCLPGRLVRDSVVPVSLGAGHLGALCLVLLKRRVAAQHAPRHLCCLGAGSHPFQAWDGGKPPGIPVPTHQPRSASQTGLWKHHSLRPVMLNLFYSTDFFLYLLRCKAKHLKMLASSQ